LLTNLLTTEQLLEEFHNETWDKLYFNEEQLSSEYFETHIKPQVEKSINEVQAEINTKEEEYDTIIRTSSQGRRDGRAKKTKELIKDLKIKLELLRYEEKRLPYFHKSNAIWSLRVEGDPGKESSWLYLAVFKGNDGKFYEMPISKDWLQENFEPEFISAFKNYVKTGLYLVKDGESYSWVDNFPMEVNYNDDEEKHEFFEALWNYKASEADDEVLFVRASCEMRMKTQEEIDLFLQHRGERYLFEEDKCIVKKIDWAVCLRSSNPTNSHHMYEPISQNEMKIIFDNLTI
jgi:hypothetical protein